jgi:pyrroline-5-carboxylate reductase
MNTIGFIGGGRVTRIFLAGWAHAGTRPSSVLVNEPDDAAFDKIAAFVSRGNRVPFETVAAADIVFLALHPPHIPAVLAAIRPLLTPGAILVSLAPKVTLQQLSAGSGTARVARVIPNAPSIIGLGYNPVSFGAGLDGVAKDALVSVLSGLGQAPEVAERDLEAFAILTGMGPTYFWPQWQALRDVARGFGLSRDSADAGLRAMVTGAIATLLDSGLPPEAVMDLVPVKPLGDNEAELVARYHALLPAMHRKIAPAGDQPAHASSIQRQG